MSDTTLLLVCASSLAWATLDALRKRLVRQLDPVPLVALLALGALPFFWTWVSLGAWSWPARAYYPPAAAAVLLNLGANLLFVRAVQVAPLSTTVPMLAFTPVAALAFSALVLHEFPGLPQALGVMLVVAGALVLHARTPGSTPQAVPWRLGLGPRLMLGTALLWALVGVADKAALRHAGPALHATLQYSALALALLIVLAWRGELGRLCGARQAPWSLTAAVLAAGTALGLQLAALQGTYVASLEALKRSVGMLASVVNGRVFFGEPFTLGKWAGVALMALGVALVLR